MARRITIAIVGMLLSGAPCFSQIQAPTQVDTLYITSMQYHFDEIRQENWPFSYVLRTPDSFAFNGQKFQIISSEVSFDYESCRECIEYKLQTDESVSKLKYFENDRSYTIKFSDYILQCKKSQNTTREITAGSSAFSTDILKSGNPKVGEQKNNSEGKPNVHLEGRRVDEAGLKKPVYKTQAEGCVVVDIWVDQYGKVVKAVPGGDGTTVTNKALWTAARNAALGTGFNMKADAPYLQQGTIIYIFNLK